MAGCGRGLPSSEDLAPSVARLSGTACGATVEGSAFVVAPGQAVANAHVVAGAVSDLVLTSPEGWTTPATVVGFDPNRDLALLAMDEPAGDPLPLGFIEAEATAVVAAVDVDVALVATEVEVLRRVRAGGEDIYREGDVERRAIEITLDARPGDSGAPVVDEFGRVVAVVFAGARNRETAWAVAASELADFLEMPELGFDPGRCP